MKMNIILSYHIFCKNRRAKKSLNFIKNIHDTALGREACFLLSIANVGYAGGDLAIGRQSGAGHAELNTFHFNTFHCTYAPVMQKCLSTVRNWTTKARGMLCSTYVYNCLTLPFIIIHTFGRKLPAVTAGLGYGCPAESGAYQKFLALKVKVHWQMSRLV